MFFMVFQTAPARCSQNWDASNGDGRTAVHAIPMTLILEGGFTNRGPGPQAQSLDPGVIFSSTVVPLR